jgi:hypothetical protein
MTDLSKEELIERTKNWGITKDHEGRTTRIQMKLSVEGSVDNAVRGIKALQNNLLRLDPDFSESEIWVDTWGITESARLYNEGREAWLRGDFETVADLFGILV